MSTFRDVLTLPVTATGTIKAYRFVHWEGRQCGAGESAIGVAQQDAEVGELFSVIHLGTAKVETGGTIGNVSRIQSDSEGRAVANEGGQTLGRLMAGESVTGAGLFAEIVLLHDASGDAGATPEPEPEPEPQTVLPITVYATEDIEARRFVHWEGRHCRLGEDSAGISVTAAAMGEDCLVANLGIGVVDSTNLETINPSQKVQSDADGKAMVAAGGVVLGRRSPKISIVIPGQSMEVVIIQDINIYTPTDPEPQTLLPVYVQAVQAITAKRFVHWSGRMAAQGESAIGVALNDAAIDETCVVAHLGTVEVETENVPISYSARVQSSVNGKATISAGGIILGRREPGLGLPSAGENINCVLIQDVNIYTPEDPEPQTLIPIQMTATDIVEANRYIHLAGRHCDYGEPCVGISLSAATTGNPFTVAHAGIADVMVGMTPISSGERLQSDSEGKAMPASGGVVLGYRLPDDLPPIADGPATVSIVHDVNIYEPDTPEPQTVLPLQVVAISPITQGRFVHWTGRQSGLGESSIGISLFDAAIDEVCIVAHLGTALVESELEPIDGSARVQSSADGKAMRSAGGVILGRRTPFTGAITPGETIEVAMIHDVNIYTPEDPEPQTLLPLQVTAVGAIANHRFVDWDGSQSGWGDTAIGVSLQAAADTESLIVAHTGVALIEAGEIITEDAARIQSDDQGRAIQWDGGQVMGRLLPGQAPTVAGQDCEVVLLQDAASQTFELTASGTVEAARFIQTNGSHSANDGHAIGVSLHAATTGNPLLINIGFPRVEAAGALSEGDDVASDAQGRAKSTVNKSERCGRVLPGESAAGAGDYVGILFIQN